MTAPLKAPFPYFGGKRTMASEVWRRFGTPKQYIEPFCGSAAVLLQAPEIASLEVVCDLNGYLANFWRAVKYQGAAVADWANYPVVHVDLGARHRWLTDPERIAALSTALQDPDWPGDAKIAGWWVWGQCCWIGGGWCDWFRAGQIAHASDAGRGIQAAGQIAHAGDAGRGIQAAGQIAHAGNAGRGIQAAGRIAHASNAGRGIQAAGQIAHASDAGMGIQAAGKIAHASDAGRGIQAAGRIAHASTAGMGIQAAGKIAHASDAGRGWLLALSERLCRVRVQHGEWWRCLNHHYGGKDTAVFLDPPYRAYCEVYGCGNVAEEVATWAADNAELRIALCGHAGDYSLPGWTVLPWSRESATYGSTKTKAKECIWFSPACLSGRQGELFEVQQLGERE
jgi:hypothetical protein